MNSFPFAASLFVGLLLSSTHFTRADEPDNRIDEALLAKLQGVWDPISSSLDGQDRPIDLAKKPSMAIEGKRLLVRFNDKVVGSLEIKHLVTVGDFGHLDSELKTPDGKVVLAKQLFQLDGERLTTCIISPPSNQRPKDLSTKKGSMHLVTVSQRRKNDESRKIGGK